MGAKKRWQESRSTLYRGLAITFGVTLKALDHIRMVLVEPSHPGNVGGCARALKNMGLGDLWLVNPSRYPSPQADWRASNALDVLDATTVVGSIEEAIADCSIVLGTSTRHRAIPWPVVTPRQAAELLVTGDDELAKGSAGVGKVAILYGRETSGLTNEELQLCNKHLTIPANPEYGSLNLAMAVQVVSYELHARLALLQEGEIGETQHWDRRWATAAEVEGFMEHLDRVLLDIDFYSEASRGKTFTRIRRLFSRIGMDETEVQMLRGVLKQMEQAAKH